MSFAVVVVVVVGAAAVRLQDEDWPSSSCNRIVGWRAREEQEKRDEVGCSGAGGGWRVRGRVYVPVGRSSVRSADPYYPGFQLFPVFVGLFDRGAHRYLLIG